MGVGKACTASVFVEKLTSSVGIPIPSAYLANMLSNTSCTNWIEVSRKVDTDSNNYLAS